MYKNDGLLGGYVIMFGVDLVSYVVVLEVLKVYFGEWSWFLFFWLLVGGE